MIQQITERPVGVIMANQEPKDAGSTNHPAPSKLDILAADRTAMAARRSYYAWISTGLSLLIFGFTIYKVLISLPVQLFKNDPLEVGLFLISIGTAAILYGTAEYWKDMSELHRDYGVKYRKSPVLSGLLITGFGVVMFFWILIRNM